MLQLSQQIEGWLWYLEIFQQEVGLHQVLCWKSVNIKGIPELTGKVPM